MDCKALEDQQQRTSCFRSTPLSMIAEDLNILKSTENHNRKHGMSTLREQKHLENIVTASYRLDSKQGTRVKVRLRLEMNSYHCTHIMEEQAVQHSTDLLNLANKPFLLEQHIF